MAVPVAVGAWIEEVMVTPDGDATAVPVAVAVPCVEVIETPDGVALTPLEALKDAAAHAQKSAVLPKAVEMLPEA
jgi:hypothetical protein